MRGPRTWPITYIATKQSISVLVHCRCGYQPHNSDYPLVYHQYLPCAHVQGVKQSICMSVVVVVNMKIAKSHVLGICACCKHNQLVGISVN